MGNNRLENRSRIVAALAVALALLIGMAFFARDLWLNELHTPPPKSGIGPKRTPAASTEPGVGALQVIDRVSVKISARDGGVIEAPGGIGRVSIPPGALAADTEVGIVRFAVHDERDLSGTAIDLLPDGLSLNSPVELSMPLPPGIDPEWAEIAVYDPIDESWSAEIDQGPDPESGRLIARLSHFSLRRVRIRPGMNYPYDPTRGRATFYLESDAGNNFERYFEGRWEPVARRSETYRELMKMGRVRRHDLISAGRLRAVTGGRPRPEIFEDRRRSAAMPSGVPEARSGWVRVTRLDAEGNTTGEQVVVRVNDYGPGAAPRRAGVVIDLSRSAMEALGLTWGEDFGLGSDNPDLAWVRINDQSTGRPLRHLPVRVEAYDPQPSRSDSRRSW